MLTREKLWRWAQAIQEKYFDAPRDVPITAAERAAIMEEEPMHMLLPMCDQSPKLFGIEAVETPFAPDLRMKRLEVPVRQFTVEYSVDVALVHNSQLSERVWLGQVIRQMRSHVMCDVTRVELTLEWDAWAWLKRALRLTRWWPVRTVKRTIECNVLYPLCKVQLPWNKHRLHCGEVRPSSQP